MNDWAGFAGIVFFGAVAACFYPFVKDWLTTFLRFQELERYNKKLKGEDKK